MYLHHHHLSSIIHHHHSSSLIIHHHHPPSTIIIHHPPSSLIIHHHHSSSLIIHHPSPSTITPSHPQGRCPFWVNFSSIFGGSGDYLGVIFGSSFRGPRWVPVSVQTFCFVNFWVFGRMSGDPPGGLPGSLGEFSLGRFDQILKKRFGVPKSVQDPPGSSFSPSWEGKKYRKTNPSTNDHGRSPPFCVRPQSNLATSGRNKGLSCKLRLVITCAGRDP